MKQLAVFFFLFFTACAVDLRPVQLDQLRTDAITVTVEGEVDHPGEITLPLYATVEEALAEAGVQADGDVSALNPQTILKDHDMIRIDARKPEGAERISINRASAEQLCALPGIGMSTAEKIIAYRSEQGLFQTIEDLTNVSGIGKAKLDKLKDLISL